MQPGTRRYTVETLRAGQAGPHQASIYVYRMTCEEIKHMEPDAGSWVSWSITPEYAKRLARTLGREFKEPSENPKWHEPRLERFDKVAPGVWEWQIRLEYTG